MNIDNKNPELNKKTPEKINPNSKLGKLEDRSDNLLSSKIALSNDTLKLLYYRIGTLDRKNLQKELVEAARNNEVDKKLIAKLESADYDQLLLEIETARDSSAYIVGDNGILDKFFSPSFVKSYKNPQNIFEDIAGGCAGTIESVGKVGMGAAILSRDLVKCIYHVPLILSGKAEVGSFKKL